MLPMPPTPPAHLIELPDGALEVRQREVGRHGGVGGDAYGDRAAGKGAGACMGPAAGGRGMVRGGINNLGA
jgi:hypothetical protein